MKSRKLSLMNRILFSILSLLSTPLFAAEERPPNIVYIMSDELAYFELAHMGNPYLKTPNIDAMAKEGLRFTNALAAAPVCGPLRGSLMTGKHQGHCSIRANDGGTALRTEDITIAEVLKQKKYVTGGYGKWGAGGRDSTGVPEKHGFDDFFGYYDQVHAHSFYPPYLVRNSEEVPLKGNIGGRTGDTYSHYKIMREGLKFIRENKDKPFFAYFPITPPHGMYDIPAVDPAWDLYKDEAWMNDPKISQEIKNYAAMVTMIDRDLGDVLELLKAEGLEENTIVFFTGDNGGQDRFKSKEHPRGFFMPNKNPVTGVEFRGGKGNLYEGGLKIPFFVRWPGKIEAGRTSDLIFNQVDIFPTLADLTDTIAPDDLDGISILPEILGDSENQKQHEMLYWEYSSQTAVRFGKWKAIQPNKFKTPSNWELFDLEKDISEENDVAADHSEILEKMITYAEGEHEEWKKGTYSDPARTRHERDRQAKWGTSRPPEPKKENRPKAHRINDKNLIPADEMTLVRFSSQNRQNDRLAEYAIDGKLHTLWHSQFTPKRAEPPHDLIIDLGKSRSISGFRYLSRQDGGWNGSFAETEFYVSNDAEKFGDSPVLTRTFTKEKTAQAADLEQPAKGRYVRVRVKTDITSKGWGSAAEIGIIEEPGEKGPDGKSGIIAYADLARLDAWKGDLGEWAIAKSVTGSTTDKKWDAVADGEGIFYNGNNGGKTTNLISKMEHGDVKAVIEFMIPAKSNSGIYFQNRYELQILDSFGKSDDEFGVHDMGAIYERWDKFKPKGQNDFEGTAPSSNASKAPGEWQRFEITFRAPRFDSAGKKTENAKFVSVKLNSVEIHKNVEVTGPTRGGKEGPEAAKAPINIQGNHGPVAFRKLKFTPVSLD